MSTMRPIRTLATALLVASLAVTGCGRDQPDQPTTPPDQPPVVTTTAPTPKAPAPAQPPPSVPASSRSPPPPSSQATGMAAATRRRHGDLPRPGHQHPAGAVHPDPYRHQHRRPDQAARGGPDGRDGWTLAYRDRAGGHLGIAAIGAGGRAERMLNVYRAEPPSPRASSR